MRVLNHLPEKPDGPNLLRRHVADAVSVAVERSRRARDEAGTPERWESLRQSSLQRFRAAFPPELFAMRRDPVQARPLARHERKGYRIETVLFTSLWGWEVNAHLCIPEGTGPWPAIVCPTGHGAKTQADHQTAPVGLALNGFVALAFDSPWQGEKAPGNDHFQQGTACLLTGLWSETFFAMDALRAIDYLATRPDVDLSRGVGMTGVSGGGETTVTCALLDERIRCIAPVCCAGAQAVIGARDFFTSCPETMGPGLLGAGIDVPEKLALAAPLPCLVVSGALDEVFYPAMVKPAVAVARTVYERLSVPDRFAHFEQPDSGHAYTPVMAERVAEWMRRWLCGETKPAVRVPSASAILETAEVIGCHPNSARNMQSINAERASACAASGWGADIDALRQALCVGETQPLEVREAGHEMSWWHRLERVAIRTEAQLWVPAICAVDTHCTGPRPALLWIDDRGKWSAFEAEGWPMDVAAFLHRGSTFSSVVCSADVRGWGETEPEHAAYDLANWNDITRILSYLSVGLGAPLMGGRTRDALAALSWFRSRPDVDASRVLIGGHGAGGLVALFAALLDGRVAGFVGTAMLASYCSLTGPEGYSWGQDIVVPGVLACGDIPEFLAALQCPALAVSPLDHHRRPLASPGFPANVSILPAGTATSEIVTWVRSAVAGS